MPILNKFKKSKTISSVFAALCVLFVVLAATPAGFPYTKDVHPQRFYVLVRILAALIIKHPLNYETIRLLPTVTEIQMRCIS